MSEGVVVFEGVVVSWRVHGCECVGEKLYSVGRRCIRAFQEKFATGYSKP